MIEQSRVSNQDSCATSIWQPLSLCFPSEVSTLLLPHKLDHVHRLFIHIDISPLHLSDLLVHPAGWIPATHMHPCGVMKSIQLQDLAPSLFPACIKLLGFNRQDRDSISLNGQYLSSSINWQCSFRQRQAPSCWQMRSLTQVSYRCNKHYQIKICVGRAGSRVREGTTAVFCQKKKSRYCRVKLNYQRRFQGCDHQVPLCVS